MLISGSDAVAAALGSALDGLALRQRIAADNIANLETPGFTASVVDFEGSLRTALTDGTVDADEHNPAVSPSAAPAGANGNNVDLATEQMTAMQATFRYQLLSRAVSDRLGLVTKAIGGM